MTLTNTNKASLENYEKPQLNEKLIIFLFSFLPLSLIIGNSAINLNILIIDLLFLFTCYYQKNWSWIKNKYLYFFIFIWIYLILNSIISTNVYTGTFDEITKQNVYPQKDSIVRSIGFVRFFILLFAFQYFFVHPKKIFDKIFFYWSIVIFIVFVDIIFERIFGFNLFGFKSLSSHRVVSFFKDELVVGGFVLSFAFIISGYLFELTKKNPKQKIFAIVFFCLSIICIYLSGERSNFIKALFITFFMLIMVNNSYLYIKKKYILLLIIFGILTPFFISENIYNRQVGFFKNIKKYNQGSYSYEKFGHMKHFAHYDTSWQIFKDYPISGIGNSKFRYVCHNKKYFNAKIEYSYQRCSNHPHQIHFEILSEEGILGYLIIIFTIFHILLNSFKIYFKKGNIINLASILFVLAFFIPLLPSGSFFSTFNASMFWINLSLAHAFLNKPN